MNGTPPQLTFCRFRPALGAIVAYANEVKEAELGFPREVLATHGAVSAETAAAMARGARERLGADIAVWVTGIGRAGWRDAGETGRPCVPVRRGPGGGTRP